MNILWKGVTAVLIAGSAMIAASAPAQAHDRYGWRGDNYRGDYYRGDRWRGDRWDRYDRRDWRRDHRRSNWRGDRRRCWNEWRYDRYRHRDVRVRICR
ncbi:MAG: hypothetical protein ACO1NM_04125 [Sphingobium phenoxybenzoativorans]|uniref:Uncharacterized protein n=1 Tax=Sphingobium phenoxybenzoativorans TaxID=1592790 RepID=A0A975K5G4_9SPHN|nr:hypothetical protein [Sphingobium phenoxybenzoativorans]QUT04699.1 hypothetical protein KFK14_16875 [Sphingobium phenoxybenzoativorans]